jgi:hypothetical protein
MQFKYIILALVLLASPANAGYYGYQYNWNPWHPWHAWHAPQLHYSNTYRWGYNYGNGWGRCRYASRCGWGY